jgi:hypothetical protein
VGKPVRSAEDVAVPEQDSNTRILRFLAVTVRRAENPAEAEKLLPLPVLTRLTSGRSANWARQRDVYLSQLMVAIDGEYAVGFVAYRPTAGGIRVAHEFWIDPEPTCGLASAVGGLLAVLESAAVADGCSRLFLVVAHSAPLWRVLENSGYAISLAGGEVTWFEKSLLDDWRPLESA